MIDFNWENISPLQMLSRRFTDSVGYTLRHMCDSLPEIGEEVVSLAIDESHSLAINERQREASRLLKYSIDRYNMIAMGSNECILEGGGRSWTYELSAVEGASKIYSIPVTMEHLHKSSPDQMEKYLLFKLSHELIPRRWWIRRGSKPSAYMDEGYIDATKNLMEDLSPLISSLTVIEGAIFGGFSLAPMVHDEIARSPLLSPDAQRHLGSIFSEHFREKGLYDQRVMKDIMPYAEDFGYRAMRNWAAISSLQGKIAANCGDPYSQNKAVLETKYLSSPV